MTNGDNELIGASFIELAVIVFAVFGVLTLEIRETLSVERENFSREKLIWERENQVMRNSLGKAKDEIDSLHHEVRILKEKLNGRPLPSCRAVGLQKGYLAEVSILSTDMFMIEEVLYNLERLGERFKKHLNLKSHRKCVPLILARETAGIAASEMLDGINSLEKLFYVHLRE